MEEQPMDTGNTEDLLQGVAPVAADLPAEKESRPSAAEIAGKITSSPAFIPGLVLLLGLGLVFWRFWPTLYDLWMEDDGYYSHGFLVPLISGYIVYRWWPWMSKLPVKANWLMVIPLLGLLALSYVASAMRIEGLMSLALLAVISCSVWVIAGWRWFLATIAPVGYLVFAMPVWRSIIDDYTNPLQLASTQIAFNFLKLFGFYAYMSPDEPTQIMLNSYQLNVAVPCSGLKLVVALTAFTVFFVLIAKLRPWANGILLTMILPLALMINGLRIALIGVVGELQGSHAAEQFHDYSGYITLGLCFFILFKLCRLLGWKD